MLNRRAIGSDGEKRAVTFLKKQGFSIHKTNYRSKVGEIDIIATKNDLIAFIEVKTRQSDNFGRPEEAVNRKKQRRIIRAAKYYLITNDLYDKIDVRFDVLSLTRKKSVFEIEYFENAFREEK
ncbi:MAG: YraN family protein [Candidatus Cloacimonadota bacterium]|nr:MAG: YraN family protein [Candidatus Cloacimonadota bacterium]